MTFRTFFTCAALLCLAIEVPAVAQLTLTPQGISDGFTLSTFLSGYTPSTYGPLAPAVLNGKSSRPARLPVAALTEPCMSSMTSTTKC